MSIHIESRKRKNGLAYYVYERWRDASGKTHAKLLRRATEEDLGPDGPVVNTPVNTDVNTPLTRLGGSVNTPASIESKQNIMASLGFSQGVVSNPKADAKIESPMREHIPPTTVSDYLQQRRDQRASEQRYSDNGYWPDD